MNKKFVITVVIMFLILSAVIIAICTYLPGYRMALLLSGNGLMLVMSLISFFIAYNQIKARPQAFVRGVFSGIILKLMVYMVAVMIYAAMNRGNIHKPSMIVLLVLYGFYSVTENRMLSHMARGKS